MDNHHKKYFTKKLELTDLVSQFILYHARLKRPSVSNSYKNITSTLQEMIQNLLAF